MKLAEIQAAFAGAIEGGDDNFLPLLTGASAGDRIDIYRNNHLHTKLDALLQIFPILNSIVGEQCFGQLCREYCKVMPDQGWDLNRYGAGFDQLLCSLLSSGRERFPWLSDYPYFPDLASLEHAINQAYYSADVDAKKIDPLRHIDVNRQAYIVFQLHPGLSLLQTPWPLFEIWQAYNRGQLGSAMASKGDEYLVIYRQHFKPVVEKLGSEEFALMKNISEKHNLGQISSLPQAETMLSKLPHCCQRGWICGFDLVEMTVAEQSC